MSEATCGAVQFAAPQTAEIRELRPRPAARSGAQVKSGLPFPPGPLSG